jgi:hypothetical protein
MRGSFSSMLSSDVKAGIPRTEHPVPHPRGEHLPELEPSIRRAVLAARPQFLDDAVRLDQT